MAAMPDALLAEPKAKVSRLLACAPAPTAIALRLVALEPEPIAIALGPLARALLPALSPPMAMDLLPWAWALAPIAVEYSWVGSRLLASAPVPIAVAPSELAVARSPTAVLLVPLALLLWPEATLKSPAA
nr:hypothetical protein [Bradyrhizobium liaoningense]